MDDYTDDAEEYTSAQIYGQSGALKDLLRRIADPKIRSLEDIARFRNTYPVQRKSLLDDSKLRVEEHLRQLNARLASMKVAKEGMVAAKTDELNQTLSRLKNETSASNRKQGPWQLMDSVIVWFKRRRIKYILKNFQRIIRKATRRQERAIVKLEVEINGLLGNIESVAQKWAGAALRDLDRLESRLEDEKFLYFGAVGESDVIRRLGKLSADYHVINDYQRNFRRPIYNRAENDRIYSIQVDHLVVGPTGIFVIETKNWSDESLASETFFSPVKQVQRAGFALFVLLNQDVRGRGLLRHLGRWGGRKISPRQMVVFRNRVPQDHFKFVKLLGIDRLNAYITNGQPCFEIEDVHDIVNYLLDTNSG